MASPGTQLEQLECLREEFGAQAARQKLELFTSLENQSLSQASDVERLHEALCFVRAWPDSPQLLTTVNRMLANFGERKDLQRFAGKLADTGITGTEIRFRFYFATAQWLAKHWGEYLQIDWKKFGAKEQLASQLRFLTLFGERAALEQFLFDSQEWVEQMRGNEETDAVFLISRFTALRVDESVRDAVYEQLDPALQLAPSATSPARTREYVRPRTIHYQRRRIDRNSIDLRQAAKRRIDIAKVPHRQARQFVDLARSAMVSRLRDLDAFAYASVDDVLQVQCQAGVQILLFGMRPERRYFLECEYGYLMLKNGAVIGYGTGTGLFGTCQLAFNLFPTYRGTETRALYAYVLATFRRLFNADTFSVDAYQIGSDNEEAINSGAWWFYARMGFLPRDKTALSLAKAELRNGRRKGYRTTKRTLRRLARHTLFFSLAGHRQDVLGPICTDTISLGVIDYVSRRFGSRREAGFRRCSRELAEQLRFDTLSSWSVDEKRMWHRLSPLLAAAGGAATWPKADRDALVEVIRAKGGVHEADYVRLFDAHNRLRRALAAFSKKAARL